MVLYILTHFRDPGFVPYYDLNSVNDIVFILTVCKLFQAFYLSIDLYKEFQDRSAEAEQSHQLFSVTKLNTEILKQPKS